MSQNNASIILEGCIKRFKDENNLEIKDCELFELFSLIQITKRYNLSYEDIKETLTDGGNDGGIDSIIILVNEESINETFEDEFKANTVVKFIISQCKKENSLTESTIDKLITSIPELFDLSKNETSLLTRFNSSLVNRVILLKDVWEKAVIAGTKISVEVNYICNAEDIRTSTAFDSKVKQLKSLCKSTFSIDDINYYNYSSKELLMLYQAHKKNRLTIEFKDTPLSTNYGEKGLGYIGTVNILKYKKFITSDSGNIIDDLFESNIRHYQGNVDVNKKIQNTLIDRASSRDFWWLNNGITIIAENPSQMGKNLTIENVQIVNGLQTSYSIFKSDNDKLPDLRSVLVKVIINTDKDITDDIIESTNYQNMVSPALLRATEKIQKDIEIFFINNGYFYDRRKNYYKNLGKPVSRIFSITYTAQAIAAIILGEPHVARATPTALLKAETTYKSIFNEKNNYKTYLNCCLIVSKIHTFILNIDDSNIKNSTVNFKYHISLICCILLLKSEEVLSDGIAKIEIAQITSQILESSLKILWKSIKEYQEINSQANLINMAKSKDFTNYIKKKTISYIQNSH